MADEEQLAILRQGPEAWNAWRREQPDAQVNLREAYLGGANLRGANLIGADLTGADLIAVDLRGANLSSPLRKSAVSVAALARW
jgi:uncharacterized protein YjbI with pentapeptide repeats